MFIKQALSFDRSCTHVVNEFIIDNIDELPKKISKSTGSFAIVGKSYRSKSLKN
jgi:hypothetical protein